MLEWDLYSENGPEASCRRELQTMLMLNMKAEMQVLDDLPGGLATWLSTELGARQGSGVNVEEPVSPVADTTSDDELLL
jgi:meiotic recombination protein SPO11